MEISDVSTRIGLLTSALPPTPEQVDKVARLVEIHGGKDADMLKEMLGFE